MLTYVREAGLDGKLFDRLRKDREIFAPAAGHDGICRLLAVKHPEEIATGTLPVLAAKKFLLPPRDILWELDGGVPPSPPSPPPIALVGLSPCDLHALSYLDRVFAEDPLYRIRRDRLLLIGAPCSPSPHCFCPPTTEPPPFDLFLEEARVWAGSEAGVEWLSGLVDESGAEDLPPPEHLLGGEGSNLPGDLEERFESSRDLPFWRQTGERCLSCGACSAVCPTCYCYDVVDEISPGGETRRLREWDNCFFRNHALVAGGHNFRPTRTERLRFRFEHKLLGLGGHRGTASCVGCGRCRKACPVDIDIAEMLEQLSKGDGR